MTRQLESAVKKARADRDGFVEAGEIVQLILATRLTLTRAAMLESGKSKRKPQALSLATNASGSKDGTECTGYTLLDSAL